MAGLVLLPAPACMRSHVVPSAARLTGSSMQLRRPQWTPLTANRQQRGAPCRMQPAIVAKAAAAAQSAAPQAAATLRNQRGSPHKVRRVLDQIRGRSYEEALILLEYMPFRACEPVLDTLISAAANAKNNLGLRKAKLYVSECMADAGPILKRIRPRAKGRAARIQKPTFHLVVKVAEREA